MPTQLICADDVAQQPWRNGGGQTRELLAWPSTEQCKLRIALADIEVDGPFSVYEGVERWIVVIAGLGIELRFSDGDRRLFLGEDPLRFDGASAPECRLLDGPTRDLNLMVQGGSGVLRAVRSGEPWSDGFTMRGVFTTAAGRLLTGKQARIVPAMTLLWDEGASGEWTFEHDVRGSVTQAWWLGFTPSVRAISAADS